MFCPFLLAAEPAADPTLRLCSSLFYILIELVNGSVDILTSLLAEISCFRFGFGEFGFRVGGLGDVSNLATGDCGLMLLLGQVCHLLGPSELRLLSWPPCLCREVHPLSERTVWKHRLSAMSVCMIGRTACPRTFHLLLRNFGITAGIVKVIANTTGSG